MAREEEKLKLYGLSDSFNYAVEGLVHALKTQRNMKIHFFIAFFVLLASLFIDISKIELIIVFFSITLVITMELLNTAVEIIIDMISSEYRLRARIAKNISAGAVLMSAINALVVAYLVFLDGIRSFSFLIINQITDEPTHLIFIIISLLIIIIITLKTKGGSGTPLEGGMPSGHSALAFSLATMTVILTKDIIVSTLVILLAFLVAQSRLQTRTHSFIEVLAGAIIGVFFTLLILLII